MRSRTDAMAEHVAWLTPHEAAAYLRVGIDTIYDACADGRLKHSKLGYPARVRVAHHREHGGSGGDPEAGSAQGRPNNPALPARPRRAPAGRGRAAESTVAKPVTASMDIWFSRNG